MVKYICGRCKMFFDHKATYERHIGRKKKCNISTSGSKTTNDNQHICKICKKKYSRKDSLIRHKKSKLHKTNINNSKMMNSKIFNNVSKNISIKGSNNSQTINSNNNNTTNNYYFISPFNNEEINKLSTRDKLAIFSCDENPIIMIIIKTNLNPLLPQYHNIGYTDLNSGYGYIFNGNTWEKKDIKTIMNELLASKRKDLLKIHKEISEFLSKEDNKSINDVLYDIENIVMPKLYYHAKNKKRLVTNLKTQFYNNRNLITESIKKSGKPIVASGIQNKTRNILKEGLTIEDVEKILMKKHK